MCRDGNSASLSARYLNGQLTTLWENAVECLEESEHALDFQSEDYEKSAYTRALAQFHFFGRKPIKNVTSTDDLLFSATFVKPELKFICNHEAALYLTLKSGHLNLDYGKASTGDYQIDNSQTQHVENLQLAFRFDFSRSSLKGREANNKSSKHLVQLIVLNLSLAKLVMLRPDSGLSGAGKAALSFYMHKYLEFLQGAGIHTLYDLPDFDHKFRAKIDYSLHYRPIDLEVLCAGVFVHGTNLQEINAFLHRQWLVAASSGRPEDILSVCLAEINSSWLSVDTKFHIRFGPPKVTALCQSEVILYFDIEDIAFFKDDEETAEPDVYHKWTVAFVMDAVQEVEDGANRLRLDFQTARLSSYFSHYEKIDSKVCSYFKQIVKFLSVDYLSVLVHYQLDTLYSVDVDLSGMTRDRDSMSSIASDSSGFTLQAGDTGSPKPGYRAQADFVRWAEHEEAMTEFGFDQVLTISEQSINTVFSSYWKKASETQLDKLLINWTADLFESSFGALRVRFLSNGKAIVWVNLDEGEMSVVRETTQTNFWTWVGFKKPVKGETNETYQFNDLTLAFEVDVKLVEETELTLSDSWHRRFEATPVYTDTPSAHRVFHHLLLDVNNARYVAEISSIHGIGEGRSALSRLQTIVHYLKEYLVLLADGGYHIIHSVPVYKQAGSTGFGLTDVSCQIISTQETTIRNCAQKHKATDAPTIVVLGVCNSRALPSTQLDGSSSWVIRSRGEKTMGMACLSREAFLEGRLLHALSKVNGVTTIVPKFAGVIDGDWHCELIAWNEHHYRKGKECRWKRMSESAAGYVEYEWQHRDDWNHEHEGTYGEEKSGEYRLSCHTRNLLRVPIAFRPNGLEIELRGESTIKVSGKTDHEWSMKSSATWSTSVIIYSETSGLTVELSAEAKPVFAEVEAKGDSILNVQELHAMHLPKAIDMGGVISEVKSLWEGAWTSSSLGCQSYALSNPVFNRHGDLLVQLGLSGARQTVYGIPRKRKSALPAKLTIRQTPSASPLRGLDVPLPPSTASSASFESPPPQTPPVLSVSIGHSPSRTRVHREYVRREEMVVQESVRFQEKHSTEYTTSSEQYLCTDSGF